MAEAQEEVTWTYTNEDGRYDASLLTDPGKQAFNLLLEVNTEIQTLGKRTSILKAAALQLNMVVQNGLTEEALIEPIEDKDSAADNGDSDA